jgi:hypothetical protein
MVVTNPISITFNELLLGGSSQVFQLLGPYVIDKSYDSIRIVADVVVVASNIETLAPWCDNLESKFRERLVNGQSFVIAMADNSWTYEVGVNVLKVTSSITKSGNPDFDRGASRAYTLKIEGELPANAPTDDGLRDIEALVDYSASRQAVVTFRGTYTTTSAGDAKTLYETNGDAVCTGYLTVVDSVAVWELADETYSLDREGDGTTPSSHVVNFTRQYVMLLASQSSEFADDPAIVDHRVTFTQMTQGAGDSLREASRLRRVIGSYDCGVRADETTDLSAIYKTKIRGHVQSLFVTNFNPVVFAIEEERVSYDETANRISVSIQFLYQDSSGEDIIEIAQSVTVRETRTIDYTPTHDKDEHAYEADVGWATLERVWVRVVLAVGFEPPKSRIHKRASTNGVLGRFDDNIRGQPGPDGRDTAEVQEAGWNVISSSSQVTPQYLGDPSGPQIEATLLTENVVERWHKKPAPRAGAPLGGPITPGGG